MADASSAAVSGAAADGGGGGVATRAIVTRARLGASSEAGWWRHDGRGGARGGGGGGRSATGLRTGTGAWRRGAASSGVGTAVVWMRARSGAILGPRWEAGREAVLRSKVPGCVEPGRRLRLRSGWNALRGM